MPVINCPAGHRFIDTQMPSPYLHYIFSDADTDEIITKIMETIEQGEDIEVRIAYLIGSMGKQVYRCPECGRLLLPDAKENFARFYVPEVISSE